MGHLLVVRAEWSGTFSRVGIPAFGCGQVRPRGGRSGPMIAPKAASVPIFA